jgi:sugar lactone lactonase YvrE
MIAGAPARAQHNVLIPGDHDFPESITGLSDGTLIMSAMAGGKIFRAAPGATEAAEWIKPGTNGLLSALGVLADEATNTLYVCSPDMSWVGVKVPTGQPPGALKTFDLKTGAAKASFPLPDPHLLDQTSLCNDIVIGKDGSAYVTDTFNAQILKLKPGASALEVWATDDRWKVKGPQLDGLTFLDDGNIYVNIFGGDGLYRVAVKPDGSAGTVTKLKTSRPLFHSDGLRRFAPDKLLMVEGETVGTLDLITVSGDEAKIDVLRDGFLGPVSVWQVGNVAYVLDCPLKYLFNPDFNKQKPPPTYAVAVPLPPS